MGATFDAVGLGTAALFDCGLRFSLVLFVAALPAPAFDDGQIFEHRLDAHVMLHLRVPHDVNISAVLYLQSTIESSTVADRGYTVSRISCMSYPSHL